MPVFIAVGVLFTCVAVALVAIPLLRQGGGEAAPIAATISAVLIPAMVLLLYVTVSNHGWEESTAAAPSAMAPDLGQAVARLEARLAEQPGDLDGWLLLGNSYVQLQRYAEAATVFSRALALSGGSNTVAKLGLDANSLFEERVQARC